MSESITFAIPGKPFAKQRPRHGKGRTYTPKETVSFEEVVRSYGHKYFKEPIKGPVQVTVYATFEPAKSWSKKRRNAAIGRYHTQKPDSDNIIKAILDGLNRVAYEDDSQVADQRTRKMWGQYPGTVVIVTPLSGGAVS